MIKPLIDVTAAVMVNGKLAERPLVDSEFDGMGKEAYKALLRSEDISANVLDGEEWLTAFVPYHAVQYATVEHSSTEAADPVDDLCVGEEEEDPLVGLWRFHDAPSTDIDAVTNFQVSFSTASKDYGGMQVRPDNNRVIFTQPSSQIAYQVGTGWFISNDGTANKYIRILSVSDEDREAFSNWFLANADKIIIPDESLSGTKWLFNETPVFTIAFKTLQDKTFTIAADGVGSSISGQTFKVHGYIGPKWEMLIGSSTIYSSDDNWSHLSSRTVLFGEGSDAQNIMLIGWLSENATLQE